MELRYIFEILWRHQRLMFATFLLIFLPIVLGSVLVTPRYDSTAKVMIRKNVANFAILKIVGLHEQTISTTPLADTDREDYLALGNLRSVAEKAITDLHLQRTPTRIQALLFIPGLQPLLRLFGVDLSSFKKDITAEQLLDSSLLSALFPRPHAEISQHDDTDIIDIKAISTDPAEAMQLANALAKALIEEEQLRIKKEYSEARVFVEKNINQVRNEYEETLNAVIKLKEQEQILDSDTETSTLIEKKADFQQIVQDNKLAIIKQKAAIVNIQTQLHSIDKFQKSSERLKANEGVKQLKENIQTLYVQLAESEIKYTPEHPAYIEITAKIDENKKLLQQEIQKEFSEETVSINPIHENLTQKLTEALSELAGLESQQAALPIISQTYATATQQLPKKVADLSSLQLAIEVNQDLYKVFLQHQTQITMAETAALSDLYLIESAIAATKGSSSKHKRPDVSVNTILAIVLGTFFAIGSTLFIHYLDDTIYNAGEIPTPIDLIGTIPHFCPQERLLTGEAPLNQRLNEGVRGIRRILLSGEASPQSGKSFAVMSLYPGEGKSTFIANLAVSAARSGRKVLIVDGNLHQPQLQNFFKTSTTAQLPGYLNGTVEQDEVISATDIPGLDAVLTDTAPSQTETLDGARFTSFIREMETRYDLILLDTPPLSLTSDALVIAHRTAASILVMQSGMIHKEEFTNTLSTLKKAEIHLAGVLLNNFQRILPLHFYLRRHSRPIG